MPDPVAISFLSRGADTMSSAYLPRVPAPALTDHQVYRLLFAGTFVIFFAVAVIGRLIRLLSQQPRRPMKSIVAEARETGSSTLLFAFMG